MPGRGEGDRAVGPRQLEEVLWRAQPGRIAGRDVQDAVEQKGEGGSGGAGQAARGVLYATGGA